MWERRVPDVTGWYWVRFVESPSSKPTVAGVFSETTFDPVSVHYLQERGRILVPGSSMDLRYEDGDIVDEDGDAVSALLEFWSVPIQEPNDE